ncbi:MAG: ROK family protein [Pyrinomonadaceae bacterium]
MMNEMNSQAEKLVGVEISGSMLKAVCLDKNGAVVDSAEMPLAAGQEIPVQLTDFINQLKDRFGKFEKIGVALPGLLNLSTKRIALSKQMPENTEIDLTDAISSRTGIQAILENDANAGAYGEYMLGAGRRSRDMLYVTLGAGVGGAFIFNGKLWRGAAGFAGELGYINIDSEGLTLEEVASADSIVRRINTRVSQDTSSSLAKINEEDVKISHIVRAAKDGDGFALMMLERTGTYIGVALATVINLLNIGKIVVGGEVMEAGISVLNGIRQSAGEMSFKPSFETTEIVAGTLGANAEAIGAALLSAGDNQQNFN